MVEVQAEKHFIGKYTRTLPNFFLKKALVEVQAEKGGLQRRLETAAEELRLVREERDGYRCVCGVCVVCEYEGYRE